MSFKRIVLLLGVFLFLYLGLYAWNSRSGVIDRLTEHTGLEFVGLVLKPGVWVQDTVTDFWSHYLYLMNVREENDRLREQVASLSHALLQAGEDLSELRRLRSLLLLTPPEGWLIRGSRVLAGRIGPLADVGTLLIDSGYFSGAGPDTPVATEAGVVGRVLRAAPYTAMILLVTDPSSNIAVISAQNRVAGIISGNGPNQPLDMKYVTRGVHLQPGELLVTSGRDNIFPSGLPVAMVTAIEDDPVMPFQRVQATPLVNTDSLEAVLLLERKPMHHGLTGSAFGAPAGPEPGSGPDAAAGTAP